MGANAKPQHVDVHGGKERTLNEYAALLTEAGFVDVTGCRTNSPLDATLAIKPDAQPEAMQTIFAIGYSVRALVEACVMAGFDTIAIDHFGDTDTRGIAKQHWIPLELTPDGHLTDTAFASIKSAVESTASRGVYPTVDSTLQSAPHSSATNQRNNSSAFFLLGGGMENLGQVVEQLRSIATVLGPTEVQRIALRDLVFCKS